MVESDITAVQSKGGGSKAIRPTRRIWTSDIGHISHNLERREDDGFFVLRSYKGVGRLQVQANFLSEMVFDQGDAVQIAHAILDDIEEQGRLNG